MFSMQALFVGTLTTTMTCILWDDTLVSATFVVQILRVNNGGAGANIHAHSMQWGWGGDGGGEEVCFVVFPWPLAL